MSQTPSSSSHHKKCRCSESAQRVRSANAEGQRAFGYRDVSKCRGASGGTQRSRRGAKPDIGRKGTRLGGAAKAVVRGWLENDGD
ncbi:hypothetical protein XH92_21885 [Bradyrhizobium sp. CCBAU 53421]|nr:hypothetical protein XH92_21885 [Bradyrhizobium sp. CCBAU 53421]